MELVEGATLADRIAQRRDPVDEALPIAKQIAEALEAAHEQGIIHRDIKPANIKVRTDGTVKVLDFGLAKATAPTGAMATYVVAVPDDHLPGDDRSRHDSGHRCLHESGAGAGQGRDTRTDIWAFGCVLYEMLTGQRAFVGQGVSETLARVIEREPDWARLPTALSPALRTYVARCLHKDPRQRVQAIGDVRLALEGAFEAPGRRQSRRGVAWRRVALVGATAIVAGGAIVGSLTCLAMRQPPRPGLASAGRVLRRLRSECRL